MPNKTPAKRRKPVRPARSTAARDEVLSTLELLECVLQHVDMQSLLVSAQRVCVLWRHVISSSPRIQRDTFFTPSHALRPDKVQNPLLQMYFEPWLKDMRMEHTDTREARLRHYNSIFFLGVRNLMAMKLGITDMRDGRRRHLAFTREGASWRRMLVAQPPLTKVAYYKTARESSEWVNSTAELKMIQFPDGLRMGQLYDMVYSVLWDRPAGGLDSAWIAWKTGDDDDGLGEHWTNPVPRNALGWEDDVEIVVGEEHVAYVAPLCMHHHSPFKEKRCREQRIRYRQERWRAATRWMFRCEEFNSCTM